MRQGIGLLTLTLLFFVAPAAGQAQGWYLLAPPYKSAEPYWDLDAAISKWQHLNSHDTAANCQSVRQMIVKGSGIPDKAQAPITSFEQRVDKSLTTEQIGALALKCISASDPRLRECP